MTTQSAAAVDYDAHARGGQAAGRRVVVDMPRRFQRLAPIQRAFGRPVFCILLTMAGIFLDIPLIEGRQFFVSHALLIALIGVFFIRGYSIESRKFQTYTFIVAAIFGASLLSGVYHGLGPRVQNDTTKLLMYAFGIFGMSRLLTSDQLFQVLRVAPMVLVLYCVTEAAGSDDLFAVSGRFVLENTGSSNTLGAMLAVSSLPLMLSEYPTKQRLLVVATLFGVLALLMLSFSRASIIGLGVAVVLALPNRKLLLVAPAAIIGGLLVASMVIDLGEFIENADVLKKANLVEWLTERRSVNRLTIWSTILGQYINTPTAWPFGFGPGSVEYYVPSFTVYLNQSKYLYSPHSNFIGSLFYFGAVGLAMLCYLLVFAHRRADTSLHHRRLKIAIFWFYLVTFALDSHILSSQGMFIHTMFLSFLMSSSAMEIAQRESLGIVPGPGRFRDAPPPPPTIGSSRPASSSWVRKAPGQR